jgi:3-dehydroquinate dehydratase II
MKTIAVINGPNLNRLGKREPHIYGDKTLADLEDTLRQAAPAGEVELVFFQSNHEGEIIDKLAELADRKVHGVILNAAGLTHTSVALRDAIAASGLPTVEVHISNVHAREEFRHRSLTAGVCRGVISGLGFFGYGAALQFLLSDER